jgi:hypothetical protein
LVNRSIVTPPPEYVHIEVQNAGATPNPVMKRALRRAPTSEQDEVYEAIRARIVKRPRRSAYRA